MDHDGDGGGDDGADEDDGDGDGAHQERQLRQVDTATPALLPGSPRGLEGEPHHYFHQHWRDTLIITEGPLEGHPHQHMFILIISFINTSSTSSTL